MEKAKANDDRIPFTQWQRHDEASEAYFRTKARGDSAGIRGGRGDSNIIKVKNGSGAARRRGDILEFTGYELTDPSSLDDLPMAWLTGGSPTLVNGFGVLLRATPDGELDSCQVAGVCGAYVNVTDADHRYAVVAASTYVLQSAAIGPVKILYKPSGTGELVAFVNLIGMVGEILVKNDTGSPIAVNSSGTFKIFSGTVGSESDTGQTISAYNKSSVPFADGKFGSVSILEGRAYAVPWQT